MKKRSRLSAYAGLLAVTVSAGVLGLAAPATADTTQSYSHDSGADAEVPDWMKSLPDEAKLSELTLPGTHDSGAYLVGGDAVETQSMNLNEQLKAGIRVWDIRLGLEDFTGRLKVFHGDVIQGQDFEDHVLATADRFLAAHSGETVLMRIKRDHGTADGFDGLVRAGLDRFSRVYRGVDDNPSLAEIRGKIVVLQDYDSRLRAGIPWGGLAIQDKYNLRTNWDLADKWRAIKGHLDAAQSGPAGTTYVNFLSGSGGAFPYFVASGNSSHGTNAPNLLTGMTRGFGGTCNSQCIPEFPSVACGGIGPLKACSVEFEGTDIITKNELYQRGQHRFGIIMADFPGGGLIHAIISANNFRGGLYKLQSSDRCLDVPSTTPGNSIGVTVYYCHGAPNQVWTRTPYGQLKAFGTMCLDVRKNGTADGTPVQIYECNGTGAQVWRFQDDGTIVNPDSGKCLDATSGEPGAPLTIYQCHGNFNQRWVRV